MHDERLDLVSPAPIPSDAVAEGRHGGKRGGGRFLGVRFACCDVYSRIYANRDGSAYLGHCPRCAGRVEFIVGPGGSSSRFFTVR